MRRQLILASIATLVAGGLVAIGGTPASAASCTDGASGCAWQPGDLTTHSDTQWKADLQSDLLTPTYNTVYASTNGAFRTGTPNGPGFFDGFGSATTLANYLGQSGTPAALTGSFINPPQGSDGSGQFGSQVAALKLNIDFSAAGHLRNSATAFGDLSVCDTGNGSVDDLSVQQILDAANTVLSGHPLSGLPPSALTTLLVSLNTAFPVNSVSQYARDHLVNGACPVNPFIVFTPPNRPGAVGHPITFTAFVGDGSTGLPYPNVPIRFTVSGANSLTGTVFTDADGNADVTYTGTNPGIDSIAVFADLNADGVQDGVDPTNASSATWTDSPGDLQLHGPGSTLFAGPLSAVTAVISKGGTATFSGKLVNTGAHATSYAFVPTVLSSDCDPSGCADPTMKVTGTGVTFNSTDQDYVTKPLAGGASLAVSIVVKPPSTGPARNNYLQQVELRNSDGLNLDQHIIGESITASTGTAVNDLFVTPNGSGKAGASQVSSTIATAKVLGLNQTTTVSMQLKNNTHVPGSVTATAVPAECTDAFTLTAKAGTVDVTGALLSNTGLTKNLAAGASVTLTLTLKAVGKVPQSCGLASAIYVLQASAPNVNDQSVLLLANTQAG